MADLDITQNNFSHTGITTDASKSITAGKSAVFQNISTLKTYLLTQGYTAAQLMIMNKNDLIYAARIKQGLTS